MRLFHSADWQIGAQFRQFGPRGQFLRQVRIATLRKALGLAASREVDAFLIAGDLFEDHQIDRETIADVWLALTEHPTVPVFILPGNHDPAGTPAAIWQRPPFSSPSEQVRVLQSAEVLPLGPGAVLLANALRQKRSTTDPSAALKQMSASVSGELIRIGMTHGSLAIPSMHEPDDFPIALDAASRAGLDYLAIGHWHSEQIHDGGRLVMPGTPEQTDFAERLAGHVVEVEIDRPGAIPRLTRHRVAQLEWHSETLEIGDREPEALVEHLVRSVPAPASTVLRVTLTGVTSPEVVGLLTEKLNAALSTCAVLDIRDQTRAEVRPEEWERLVQDHPLLSNVMADLDLLERGGQELGTIGSIADLATALGCPREELDPQLVSTARRILLSELQKLRH